MLRDYLVTQSSTGWKEKAKEKGLLKQEILSIMTDTVVQHYKDSISNATGVYVCVYVMCMHLHACVYVCMHVCFTKRKGIDPNSIHSDFITLSLCYLNNKCPLSSLPFAVPSGVCRVS